MAVPGKFCIPRSGIQCGYKGGARACGRKNVKESCILGFCALHCLASEAGAACEAHAQKRQEEALLKEYRDAMAKNVGKSKRRRVVEEEEDVDEHERFVHATEENFRKQGETIIIFSMASYLKTGGFQQGLERCFRRRRTRAPLGGAGTLDPAQARRRRLRFQRNLVRGAKRWRAKHAAMQEALAVRSATKAA